MKIKVVFLIVLCLGVSVGCAAPRTNPSSLITPTPTPCVATATNDCSTPTATRLPGSAATPTPCITVTAASSGSAQASGVATAGAAGRTTPGSLSSQPTLSPEMLATLEARVGRTGGGPTIPVGAVALPICPTPTPSN